MTLTNPTPPIGLSGFAGSGKTAAAEYLQSKHGYKRLHIAEPLRRMLRSLLFDFGMTGYTAHHYLEGGGKESVIPCLGVTSRHAQISLGTEWGREQISPDLWANCWKHTARGVEKPMNDSVRFPNEEQCIRDLDGFTILIVRPGKGPAAFKGGRFMRPVWRWLHETFGVMHGVHDSERVDRLKPDYVIHNTGSLDDLYAMLDWVMDVEASGARCRGATVIRPEWLPY